MVEPRTVLFGREGAVQFLGISLRTSRDDKQSIYY